MFQNSETIQILSLPENPRPYLILIRAGSKPRPSFFKEPAPYTRNYDIGLNYYSPPHPDDALRTTCDLVFGGGHSKLHGAKRLFEATRLHEAYNGVFFLDDDVELMFTPDVFFGFCREHTLDLAQPALTFDSSDAIGITRQNPSLILRITNFVEIMAPFLARDFLREMLHSFDLSISGWGIDVYWGHHLGDRWKAGIVDELLIRHTTPRDFANGAFYQYLRSINVDPFDEMRQILTKIGINPYVARTISGVSHTYIFQAVPPAVSDTELQKQSVRYRIDKKSRLNADDDVLVYVAFCPDGLLTELQKSSVEAYRCEGYRVLLVVNSGMYDRMVNPGQTSAASVIIRENVGFDFGAWADAARIVEGLEATRSVTFANDSVVGPLSSNRNQGLRTLISAIEADAVFMTRCLEIREHLQSYFFTLKGSALMKGALSVIRGADYQTDREQVTLNQEIFLWSRLAALGISSKEAFPCPDADAKLQNPTILHWRALIDAGYPFVKVSLVSGGVLSIESPELAGVLGEDGLQLLRLHLSKRGWHH